MTPKVTLLQLVRTVGEFAESEAELLATLVYMVNAGRVELVGTFRAQHFDLDALAAAA